MKRAQTEIIGLVVIVVLFIFIGLIYIMFAGKEDTTLTRDITQTGKVQNMLDAFMQITPCSTELPLEQMDKIIKKCYTGTETICGKDCKELILGTLENMMKAYNPRQEYEFKITGDEEFISQGQCLADTKAATERIVAGKQVLTVKLVYCEK